jgi:acetyl-CoA carboxylase biotin carboxyl carrier protein
VSKDYRNQIDQLAELVREFKLSEATFESEDFKISLKKPVQKVTQVLGSGEMMVAPSESHSDHDDFEAPVVPVPVNHGTPITSPMMGIFYSSSSPSAPPFVKEGETVTAGQVIGLIEAMKVFSEIHASTSGIVKKMVAENGAVVNPGDVIMYLGS